MRSFWTSWWKGNGNSFPLKVGEREKEGSDTERERERERERREEMRESDATVGIQSIVWERMSGSEREKQRERKRGREEGREIAFVCEREE
jgi:hypothetical protein